MWIIAIIGIGANLLDAVTTWIALHVDVIYEANPFMNLLFDIFGWFAYPIKLILGTWIFLPLRYCPAYYALNKNKILHIAAISALVIIALMFIYVGIKNIVIFMQHV